MKTNTLIETETQVRSRQLKLGVDWHADLFRVVRMCDGQSPQPAQHLTEIKAEGEPADDSGRGGETKEGVELFY